jgi:alginate O-acetyltransferase complex protein AlgI
MLFNSPEFAVFLAVVLPLFYALRSHWRLQNLLLLTAGYVFYGWWDWRFLGLLAVSTVADYTAGLVIGGSEKARTRKAALVLVLCFNIGLLGLFKYFNFFTESFAAAAEVLFHWHPSWTTLNVVLPVGISFYTFQSIGYSVDVYRRQIPPTRDLLSYATFVAFFPQLVAGPIERAGHLLKQLAGPRRPTPQGVYLGVCEFAWGLFKKLVIADYLAQHVDEVFANLSGHRPGSMVLATVAFAFQVYADFSGYTDMARGLAHMMGIDLVRNFNNPYFATSPQEFWRRWHISLSTWFRDYVYYPLGGSRKGELRTHLNIIGVFLLCGLWHGANWNYVLWGGVHGLGLSVQRLLGRAGMTRWARSDRVDATLGIAVTFAFCCFGLFVFRAPGLGAAWDGLVVLVSGENGPPLIQHRFHESVFRVAPLVLIDWIAGSQGFPEWMTRRSPAEQVVWLASMLVTAALLATKQGVQFFYFQF